MAAIAGANMWAVLRHNDPGHSAHDAVVHGRKLVKQAVAKAEDVAPPPRAESVAKPATKRGGGSSSKKLKATKKGRRGAAGDGKQVAPAGAMMERFARIAMAAIYGKQNSVPEHQPGGGEVKETLQAAPPREEEEMFGIEWVYEEMSKGKEEEEFIDVVAKGGTVARRARKAAVAAGGANMWAALGDDDPGHGTAYGRKHKKATAEVEEAAPVDNVHGSVCSGSSDGGAKPGKRGKKTKKKKKKKCVIVEAEDSDQAGTMDDGEVQINNGDRKQAITVHDGEVKSKYSKQAVTMDTGEVHINGHQEETPASPPSKEEEEEITVGCRAVSGRICRAVVAAAVLALWCRLGPPF